MRGSFNCKLAGMIRSSATVIIMVVMVGCLTTCATGKLHKVGGAKGWDQNVNYTDWSANEHFYVGEWLLFNFDKRYYNVLEVNETSYENCNDRVFMKNITRGGRDVYQLTEARPYYFLTSGGYCYHGMKLALVVQDQLPPAPALAPSTNASPNSFTSSDILLFLSIVISLAIMWDIDLFKAYI